MNYESFKTEYAAIFNTMMKYSPNEAGSSIYAEKLADLSDAYPEFAAIIEAEFDAI